MIENYVIINYDVVNDEDHVYQYNKQYYNDNYTSTPTLNKIQTILTHEIKTYK